MSTWLPQRDYLVGLLEGITIDSAGDPIDIGRVYGHPIYAEVIESYVTNVGGVDRIRAWEIQIDDVGIETRRIEQGHRHRYYPWAIVGWIGIEDTDPEVGPDTDDISEDGETGPLRSSYEVLVELAELIADAVELDVTLGGTALDMHQETTIDQPIPVTIVGGALVWGVVIRFGTWKVLTP